ncbi:MAG: NADH-quinone oxidoreductase subunit C [Candidatus Omnitrophota bacterium]
MSQEEEIKESLVNKFNYLSDSVRIIRPRRISVEVGLDNFMPVFAYLAKDLRFSHLCTITGLDEQETLGFIYHLAADSGILVNLKTAAPKNAPVIKTVIPYFPGAEIYERELVDLFGAEVDGLGSGNRYPLTDDWPAGEYPLRKDWKAKPAKEGEVGKNA